MAGHVLSLSGLHGAAEARGDEAGFCQVEPSDSRANRPRRAGHGSCCRVAGVRQSGRSAPGAAGRSSPRWRRGFPFQRRKVMDLQPVPQSELQAVEGGGYAATVGLGTALAIGGAIAGAVLAGPVGWALAGGVAGFCLGGSLGMAGGAALDSSSHESAPKETEE